MKFRESLVLIILISFMCHSINAQPDDFAIIKKRVVAELMKSEITDDQVGPIMNRMDKEGSFKNINYVDLSRTAGFPHRHHTSNLVYLAKAYNNKSSKYHKSPIVKEHITRALKYWVDNDFGCSRNPNHGSPETNGPVSILPRVELNLR